MTGKKSYLIDELQTINKWIVTFFGGFGRTKVNVDDLVYNTAVLLETLPNSDLLISSLLHVSLSPNFQKMKSQINWKIIHLPPVLSELDKNDIPVEVISNFDSLNISHIREELHWGLRQVVIGRFKERSGSNPDLDMVINYYSLASSFKGAMVNFRIDHKFDPFNLDEIENIKDRYYKARCLFHIYSLSDSVNIGSINNLFKIIRQIEDPHRQVRIWELCLALVEPQQFKAVLEEIEEKIKQITNIENRSRAYGRMALQLPANISSDWFTLAIKTASSIRNIDRKSQTLQEIRRVLPNIDSFSILFEEAANKIKDGWLRAKAFDKLGEEIVTTPPTEIQKLVEKDYILWTPVLLSGAINTTIKKFKYEEDIEEIWKQFADNHSEELFRKILKIGLESNRLVLTLNAAQAIESMMDGYCPKEEFKEHIYKIFPLLSNATLQTTSFILKWQQNFDEFVVGHAHLFNLENGKKVSEADIGPLVCLLDSDSDLSRLRADLVLGSNIWNVEKDRFIYVSTIGAQVLEKVAEELFNTEKSKHFRRLALRRFFGNIIHDDPVALVKWANSDSPVYALILKEIEAFTDKAFETFCDLINSKIPNEMKESLFVANCKLAKLKKSFIDNTQVFSCWESEFTFKDFYYENTIEKISKSLEEVFIMDDLNIKERIKLVTKKIVDESVSIQNITKAKADFAAIGNIFYRYLDGADVDAINLAQQLINNNEGVEKIDGKIRFICYWLYEEINFEKQNKEIQGGLIRLLSEIAKLVPNSFLVLNTELPIIDLLIARFNEYTSVWVRRGCIELIGCSRKIDTKILSLYLDQSMEDKDIWESAIKSITKIAYFEPEILDKLLEDLFSELNNQSTIRSYFSSRILVSIGKNNNTNTIQKRRILKKLTEASQSLTAQRNVYIFRGSGKGTGDVISIHSLISLEKSFNHAVVEIIGLS